MASVAIVLFYTFLILSSCDGRAVPQRRSLASVVTNGISSLLSAAPQQCGGSSCPQPELVVQVPVATPAPCCVVTPAPCPVTPSPVDVPCVVRTCSPCASGPAPARGIDWGRTKARVTERVMKVAASGKSVGKTLATAVAAPFIFKFGKVAATAAAVPVVLAAKAALVGKVVTAPIAILAGKKAAVASVAAGAAVGVPVALGTAAVAGVSGLVEAIRDISEQKATGIESTPCPPSPATSYGEGPLDIHDEHRKDVDHPKKGDHHDLEPKSAVSPVEHRMENGVPVEGLSADNLPADSQESHDIVTLPSTTYQPFGMPRQE